MITLAADNIPLWQATAQAAMTMRELSAAITSLAWRGACAVHTYSLSVSEPFATHTHITMTNDTTTNIITLVPLIYMRRVHYLEFHLRGNC